MTSPAEPASADATQARQLTKPLRELAALALLGANAVFLFVGLLRLIAPNDYSSFTDRAGSAFYAFIGVEAVGLPLLAVLLATHISPVLAKAKLITQAALVEYAVSALFGTLTMLIWTVGRLAEAEVLDALLGVLTRFAWMVIFAIAAWVVYTDLARPLLRAAAQAPAGRLRPAAAGLAAAAGRLAGPGSARRPAAGRMARSRPAGRLPAGRSAGRLPAGRPVRPAVAAVPAPAVGPAVPAVRAPQSAPPHPQSAPPFPAAAVRAAVPGPQSAPPANPAPQSAPPSAARPAAAVRAAAVGRPHSGDPAPVRRPDRGHLPPGRPGRRPHPAHQAQRPPRPAPLSSATPDRRRVPARSATHGADRCDHTAVRRDDSFRSSSGANGRVGVGSGRGREHECRFPRCGPGLVGSLALRIG